MHAHCWTEQDHVIVQNETTMTPAHTLCTSDNVDRLLVHQGCPEWMQDLRLKEMHKYITERAVNVLAPYHVSVHKPL